MLGAAIAANSFAKTSAWGGKSSNGILRYQGNPILVSSVHVTAAAPSLGGQTAQPNAPTNNSLGGGPTASGSTATIPGLGTLSTGLGTAFQTIQSKTGLSKNLIIGLGVLLIAAVIWAAKG